MEAVKRMRMHERWEKEEVRQEALIVSALGKNPSANGGVEKVDRALVASALGN